MAFASRAGILRILLGRLFQEGAEFDSEGCSGYKGTLSGWARRVSELRLSAE